MKISHGCSICSQVFDNLKQLKDHLKRDHSKEELIDFEIDPTTLTNKRIKAKEDKLIQMEFAPNKTLIKPQIITEPEIEIKDRE